MMRSATGSGNGRASIDIVATLMSQLPSPRVATWLLADSPPRHVRAVRAKVTGFTPRVGVVLGSGLGAFADGLTDLVKVPYETLPHLPASKVVGHAGNLCFGRVDDVPVVCMQGRVHVYEGHPIWQVVHGVRTMARLGVALRAHHERRGRARGRLGGR